MGKSASSERFLHLGTASAEGGVELRSERPLLELKHVSKTYPDGWTLDDVNLTVRRREIVGILGPSGCGKSTLLRLVGGLERVDSGHVLVNGEDVTHLAPHLRGFGLMFQEYALFPHKNVFGNVAFGL
ncbi:MAG: ATP-binding cassette domain-containing protein, partial [Anaerolineae bacterium]|nr:ATP-binding cassette domain-containing protein [Anaerolineae bacterium]